MIYAIAITVNTSKDEHDYEIKVSSLDTAMHDVLKHFPDCTSVLMAIVPKPDE